MQALATASRMEPSCPPLPSPAEQTAPPEIPGDVDPGGLATRHTVADLVAHHDAAIAAYDEFFDALALAHKKKDAAMKMIRQGTDGYLSTPQNASEVKAFDIATATPDPEQLRRVARRLVGIRFWRHIIKHTDLEMLMDRTAKEQLEKQMNYVPEQVDSRSGEVINQEEISRALPPFTENAILETLAQMTEDAGLIFRRGIAKVFADLDPRFRSHDGFKLGSGSATSGTAGRMILANVFSEYGSGLSYGRDRDKLIDIERVFLVLDGESPKTAACASIVEAVTSERSGYGAHQSKHTGDYFYIRCFKNGNAHLWFTRKDLVDKVNLLLAEYYGAGLGWGKGSVEPDEEAPFAGALMRPVARNYGLYPTPPAVAKRLAEKAKLFDREDGYDVLEPSAGYGDVAERALCRDYSNWSGGAHGEYARRERAKRAANRVDCVEIQPALAAKLQAAGIYRRVYAADFLKMEPTRLYDRVIGNPPFDRDRWADHAWHALKFLKPGGRFAMVLPECAKYSATPKAMAFRKRIKEMATPSRGWRSGGVEWDDQPAGSFAGEEIPREHRTFTNTTICAFTSKTEQ